MKNITNKKQYILGWNYRIDMKNHDHKLTTHHPDFIKGMKDCNNEIIKRVIAGKKNMYPHRK